MILESGLIYVKGLQEGPSQASPKPYQRADIGKEVSTQAKEIKESNATKGEFRANSKRNGKRKKNSTTYTIKTTDKTAKL